MLIRSILSTAAIGVAVVALAPTGADAATTTTRTIGGVRVDTTTYETGEGGPGVHLDLTLTTGRSLSVSCSRTGKVSVNGVWLSTACSEVRFGVAVVGSAGNDTVHIEGKDLGTSEDGGIRLNLGYGHDTAKVSHANGSAYLYGEGGNDRLYAGLRADRHHLPEWSKTVIDGGPGNDTLSNLGYLGDPEHTHDGQEAEEGATLIGGPGADRIWGSTTRWDHIQMDTSDSVSFSGGPGTVELATSSAADTVVVNANGNYGPKLNITSGTTTTSYALP
ncbi:MAG: hypothetical protein KDA97_09955, partial [Acidimicrobiales bacterium]|nr:hypothetical protein [Acidimicrobiales bacterium]